MVTYTHQQIANYINSGNTWGTNNITFNMQAVDWAARPLVELAFDAWAQVTPLTFTRVYGSADITFQEPTSGDNVDEAWANYSTSGSTITSATINVGQDWVDDNGTNVNGYLYQTYLHEIGHTLGLRHAGPYNYDEDDPNGINFADDALYDNNSWQTTVMSYFHQDQNNVVDATFARYLTPQIADVIAIQDMYGGGATNGGNTTYGYGSNAGLEVFDANLYTTNASYTIYDTGGIDTLNYSGSSWNDTIDLRTAQKNSKNIVASSVFGETNNIVIAQGTLIENAYGGSGNNTIYGNDAVNTLRGNGGNDTILGFDGNDTLEGGSGSDTLKGGGGNDSLLGGTGTDTLVGEAGNDTLTDTGYGDELSGGAGNDSLVKTGNVSNGTFDGGADNDTFRWSSTSSSSNNSLVDLSVGRIVYSGVNRDTLTSIENVALENGADIKGDGKANTLVATGNFSNDINGGGGNDIIKGGGGNDTLTGGVGADQIFGQEGNDVLSDTGAGDTLDGGSENDTLKKTGATYANAGSWNGGTGVDMFEWTYSGITDKWAVDLSAGRITYNGNNRDTLSNIENVTVHNGADIKGDNGNNTLIADGNYNNEIEGGGGDDLIKGGGGDDILEGGAGTDAIYGQDGNDTIRDQGRGDTMNGGAGNDTIVKTGSTWASYPGLIDGGTGTDTFDWDNGSIDGRWDVDLEAERIRYNGSDRDTIQNIENVIVRNGADVYGDNNANQLLAIGGASNTLDGRGGDDVIKGGGGNDILNGGAGNDTLNGQAGNDTMSGGSGNDKYYIDSVGDVVNEDPDNGTDRVISSISYTLGANIEELELSGGSNLNGTGNGLNNSIWGNSGNNLIDGGVGKDKMYGEDGNDRYIVDHTQDKIFESADEGYDSVYASSNFTLSANVEALYLTGTAKTGNGNGDNNSIYGNASNNVIDGKGGDDYMRGYEGDDTYKVRQVDDTVVETAGQGTDTVQSWIDYTLGNHVENLRLKGNGNLDATGNNLDNDIGGNSGDNMIDGGVGADVLTGLGGADAFFFADPTAGIDEVTDFTVGVDLIWLDQSAFTGLSLGILGANQLTFGAAASDGNDRIIYDDSTGDLFFDQDGVGGAAQFQFAVLDAGLALGNTDIFVA